MEARKITVVSTKTQRKDVVMSAATTLAELKNDLRNHDIDYDGMTFYEGLSKTELKSDEAILPHDIPYKGTVTNELVFMLTNPNKKIASGADRKELYNIIKSRGLEAECVKQYGRHFTCVKTIDLLALIENSEKKEDKPVTSAEPDSSTIQEVAEFKDTAVRNALTVLLDVLEDEDILSYRDRRRILESLNPSNKEDSSKDSTYSDSEISDMFDFIQ